MKKDANEASLLLEIVDRNRTLVATLHSSIAQRDHLPYRAVGSFVGDEKGCLLFGITDEGLLQLPILTLLPAGDSRIDTACRALREFIPDCFPYNERLIGEIWIDVPYPFLLAICHVRVANATLVRKTGEDPNVVLLTKIEQKKILGDASGLSPELAAARKSLPACEESGEND